MTVNLYTKTDLIEEGLLKAYGIDEKRRIYSVTQATVTRRVAELLADSQLSEIDEVVIGKVMERVGNSLSTDETYLKELISEVLFDEINLMKERRNAPKDR